MKLVITQKFELDTPPAALKAAQKLLEALALLNEADGAYAVQFSGGGCYGPVADALKQTLAYMLDSEELAEQVYQLDGCTVLEALEIVGVSIENDK